MTRKTLLEPIIVKGERQTTPLIAAVTQLKKTDVEIGTSYLYLPVGPRKKLRDKYLEMEAELERLATVEAELKAAKDLLVECDELLKEMAIDDPFPSIHISLKSLSDDDIKNLADILDKLGL